MVLRQQMYIASVPNQPSDHLQPFREYLYRHYRKAETFASGDEIWQRVDK
jgi:hypothetical protein